MGAVKSLNNIWSNVRGKAIKAGEDALAFAGPKASAAYNWTKKAAIPDMDSVGGSYMRHGRQGEVMHRLAARKADQATAAAAAGDMALADSLERTARNAQSASRAPMGLKDYAMFPGRYVNEAIKRGAYGEAALRGGIVGAGYVGAAGIVRSATTGGGMFKDSQGNTDIAGIPFI